jgi:hypothetical protein
MKFYLVVLLTFLFSFQLLGQEFKIGGSGGKKFLERKEARKYKTDAFSNEGNAIIEKCSTAKDIKYLTFDEREMILLYNLARMYPEFLTTYVANQYDTSFSNALPKYNPKPNLLPLQPSHGLYLSAKVHAKKSGENGTIGHQNLEQRILRYNRSLKKSKKPYGENCSYGDNFVISHFVQLMNSKEHFKNIMDTDYNTIGVSAYPHIKYTFNFVMCFAQDAKE